MKNMEIFEHEDFGKIRVIIKNGEPWFVAKDVAAILGYNQTSDMTKRLDLEEKSKINLSAISADPNDSNNLTIINESGLYNAVIGSEKQEAKLFKKWITSKVLPSIRKTGSYSVKNDVPDFTNPAEAARAWADQYEQRQIAEKQKQIADKDRRTAEIGRMMAEREVTEQRPKVNFANAVSSSKTTILVGEMAKLLSQNGIDIGQNRLFECLRDKGFLIKRHGTDRNMPTQMSMEMGLFEIKERTIMVPDGSVRITKTPKITGKGQQYFVNHFLHNKRK